MPRRDNWISHEVNVRNTHPCRAKPSRMSLNRKIFRIALPSIIGFLGLILFETADIFWIGRLSSQAVAAVGAAAFLEWLIYDLMTATSTGCGTLVSQFFGAQSEERFNVVRESFWLSLIISVVMMAILFFSAPFIFTFMGLRGTTWQLAMEYFTVFVIGLPIIYIMIVQGQVFVSYGDAKTRAIIMLCIVVLNIVLDPFLIFGWWIFPKCGVRGAAIATVSSQAIGIVAYHHVLTRKGYIQRIATLRTISSRYFRRILGIGLPTAATNVVWTVVYPLLTPIVTGFGTAYLAGLTICARLEGFPFYFGLGFSIAVASLVGQSYGRGDKAEVRKIAGRSTLLITLLLAPVSLAFVFIPERLVGLLNSDPAVIAAGADYLRIVGYFELFLGWELVLEGAFNGLGNTQPYMWIRVPLTLARIPLAYLFAFTFNMGVSGVWWAISITCLLKGVLVAIAFVTNRKNRELLADA
jgi:putative MATE family efflux protein